MNKQELEGYAIAFGMAVVVAVLYVNMVNAL
jgi:hypothetical protein